MPANRSRTSGWRRCLGQVHERNGALEIAVVRNPRQQEAGSLHLVWRVRLLDLTPDEIIVEQPTTLGQVIRLEPGVELVAILAVGQNRWMFTTKHLGPALRPAGNRSAVPGMRLTMPDSVERCQRRNYYRMETRALNLPEVDVWPLLDPKSVLVAERANELRLRADGDGFAGEHLAPLATDPEALMPEVGPRFTATLLNIGGGGVGLRVDPQVGQALGHHKLFWLRLSLPPELTTPICATCKLAHTSVDSTQHLYAGLAFDFSFNPAHQRFVVEQICRFITIQQKAQLAQRGDQSLRKSA